MVNLSPSAWPPTSRLGMRSDVAERLRDRRGWIVAYGGLMALLGILALVLTETATIASVLLIGCFMIVAGVVEIGVGLRTRTWGGLLLWEAAGLVYIVAGVFAMIQPLVASVVITLLLGAGLVATGLMRMVVGARMAGSRSRGGVFLAGVVSALLGVLIILGWPASSVVVLGTFLGIDLLLYGIIWMVFGYRLKNGLPPGSAGPGPR